MLHVLPFLDPGHMPASPARLIPDPGPGHQSVIDPALLDGVVARRVMAYLVDLLVIALLFALAWSILLGATVLTFGLASPGFGLLVLLPAAYHTLTIGLQGATWGQRLFGLCVADLSLRPPTLLQALIVTALFYLTVPPTGGLILLAVFFLRHRRTLHDLLAGTLVVRRRPDNRVSGPP